jgi:hypothetical protein
MRRAVLSLSSGMAYEEVSTSARTQFIDAARSPGLSVDNCDVYKLAMDYCSIITNVLYALSGVAMLTVEPVTPVDIRDGQQWKPLSRKDDSGTLHRWIFVDSWDDERFTSELHSWYTFGDIAATQSPMQLHVVEIGQKRGGRMISPWSRAHIHPIIAGRFKFTDIKGKEWKPIFFSELRLTPEEWVGQMRREGLTDSLIHHVSIKEPQTKHVEDFKRQVLMESAEMRRVSETVSGAMELPMSRGSCDWPRPCPFREVCYKP